MLVVLPGGVLLFVTDWPMAPIVADNIGQVVVAIVMIAAAFLAASSRGRLKAVILVGVTGYGTVLLFVLHGAPDLALTQVLVETVTLVAFVLVLRKLPKYFTNRPLQVTRWWRLVIAVLVGVTVSGIVLLASGSRIAEPVSKAYYEAAYEFGYGKNIVNVTLVDIRAWDTMGEISVLVVAATGVASLIFIRRRYVGERPMRVDRVRREGRSEVRHPQALATRSTWLRGTEALSPLRRSIVFEVITRLLFPVMIMCSLYFLYVGHNAPGGGFAAGLVAGLALIIRYLAGGSHELDEAAPVDAGRVLGIGLLVAAGRHLVAGADRRPDRAELRRGDPAAVAPGRRPPLGRTAVRRVPPRHVAVLRHRRLSGRDRRHARHRPEPRIRASTSTSPTTARPVR